MIAEDPDRGWAAAIAHGGAESICRAGKDGLIMRAAGRRTVALAGQFLTAAHVVFPQGGETRGNLAAGRAGMEARP